MTISRTHRQLADAAGEPVPGVGDLVAGAVLVIALRRISTAGKDIDVRIDTGTREDRAHRARIVGADDRVHVDTPAFTGTDHIVDILGAERSDATDRTRTVDVRGRAAHDIDAADKFGIEKERTVREMAGALIVLPRTVDDIGDAAEVLQTTDVDRGRRFVASILHPNAWHVIDEVADSARLKQLDLLGRHDADRRERINRTLLRFRSRHRDRVQRLRRAGIFRLRTRVPHARFSRNASIG